MVMIVMTFTRISIVRSPLTRVINLLIRFLMVYRYSFMADSEPDSKSSKVRILSSV